MNKIKFKEFEYNSVESFQFLQVPKVLINNEYFKDLSINAIFLYSVLLDTHKISTKNSWRNDEGRVYIKFSIARICEILKCSKPTAIKVLKELDNEQGIGLIEIEKQENGLANIIYVNNFNNMDLFNEQSLKDYEEKSFNNLEDDKNILPVKKIDRSKNFTTPVKKFDRSPVKNFYPNNTNINNTNNNNNNILCDTQSQSDKKINIQDQILEKWNELPDPIPKVRKVGTGTQRHKLLKARIGQYDLETILQAIENIKKSDWLLGINNSGWTITFDWFLNPNNFLKVLEGNYISKNANKGRKMNSFGYPTADDEKLANKLKQERLERMKRAKEAREKMTSDEEDMLKSVKEYEQAVEQKLNDDTNLKNLSFAQRERLKRFREIEEKEKRGDI